MFKSAAQLLIGCRTEKDLSHLALPPSGGDAFARPGHRLVHVSAFQYPKTADVFLGLKVRPVGDEDSAIILLKNRSDRAGPIVCGRRGHASRAIGEGGQMGSASTGLPARREVSR